MSQAKELTSADFDAEVLQSDMPVLVDFWAPWCGPCRMIGPILDAVAVKYAGRVKICKVNVDEAGDIAGKFGIRSIPTLMIFKAGQQADMVVGAVPEAELSQRLDRVLA
ncbi:MAG: thioredoxin [Armatimonadetes bacterium]|nr:thioredoxin [Armatimonadota bacterium]